ncbi:MAG: PxxKW family cysteine-rich protein [Desulfovibrio sp.]|nr:PxxKW family cysteine-rich protein [Desulfovibrio sp.]
MSKDVQSFPDASVTPEGMLYNGVIFQPIIDKCDGCGRVRDFAEARYCSSYPMPQAKWSMGTCNFSTHTRVTATGAQAKVNPLKASKRAAKGGGR